MKPVVSLYGVTHRLGNQLVVQDVTLHIPHRQTCAIIGPSGAGKSTLLNLIGLLDQPCCGQIFIAGQEMTAANADQRAITRNRLLGFIFQNFNLLPRLSVLDNVALPLSYRGIGQVAARQAARVQLEAMGLGQRGLALPADLSGGQRQRVAIARALVTEPAVLLADEPTGNLDGATAKEIVQLLLTLNRERGVTLLMVTHDPGMARRMERCIEVRNGGVFDA